MSEIVAFAVILANGAGQFALVAILFGTLRRHRTSPLRGSLLAGALFAACALVSMAAPAQIAPGVFLDLRGVLVGMAGAFAGWPAALVAGLATALVRIGMGGAWVAGCIAIAIAGGMGLLWRRLTREPTQARTRELAGLALMVALHLVVLVGLPHTWAPHILVPTIATLVVASLMAALTLGKLIRREERMIAQETRLAAEAHQDPLTSLLNRRGFEEAYFLARARHGDAAVAVLLVDVDFFKSVNDTHGHEVGDRVLQAIARTLQAPLPEDARASRHGGEEFALLLVGQGPDEALRFAEALRRRVAETPVPIRPGLRVEVTVSIGVALCQDGATALQDLVARADRALYRAKREGRNRVEHQAGDTASAEPTARLRVASAR